MRLKTKFIWLPCLNRSVEQVNSGKEVRTCHLMIHGLLSTVNSRTKFVTRPLDNQAIVLLNPTFSWYFYKSINEIWQHGLIYGLCKRESLLHEIWEASHINTWGILSNVCSFLTKEWGQITRSISPRSFKIKRKINHLNSELIPMYIPGTRICWSSAHNYHYNQ